MVQQFLSSYLGGRMRQGKGVVSSVGTRTLRIISFGNFAVVEEVCKRSYGSK